jgi:hypothetical protein
MSTGYVWVPAIRFEIGESATFMLRALLIPSDALSAILRVGFGKGSYERVRYAAVNYVQRSRAARPT